MPARWEGYASDLTAWLPTGKGYTLAVIVIATTAVIITVGGSVRKTQLTCSPLARCRRRTLCVLLGVTFLGG